MQDRRYAGNGHVMHMADDNRVKKCWMIQIVGSCGRGKEANCREWLSQEVELRQMVKWSTKMVEKTGSTGARMGHSSHLLKLKI